MKFFNKDSKEHYNDHLIWASRSEIGHVREHNEDSYLVQPPLFVVADGMGGHAAGEVASSIAINTLAEHMPTAIDAKELGKAVELANIEVINAVDANLGKPGMGTTCTAAMLEESHLVIAQVGDSRAYLLHMGKLIKLTHDHSFVEELIDNGEITAEEARNHPNRSIITRALGSDRAMVADTYDFIVSEHDRILLCSDGLSGMLADDELEDIMVSSPDPQDCVDSLIEAALREGGLDNVTAIVIDVENDGFKRRVRNQVIKSIGTWLGIVLLAVVIIGGMLLNYASNQWYLVSEDGLVTVYKGLPGKIGFFNLQELQNQTSITVKNLSPAVQLRLRNGIVLSSEEEMNRLLESYRKQVEDDAREKAHNAAIGEEISEAAKSEEESFSVFLNELYLPEEGAGGQAHE